MLHVAHRRGGNNSCGIHPLKWMTAFERCIPAVEQRCVPCEPPFPRNFDPGVTIIHDLDLRPWLVDKVRVVYPDTFVVGLLGGHAWWQDSGYAKDTVSYLALESCDLVFGNFPPSMQTPEFYIADLCHLIDPEIFNSGKGVPRLTDLIIARGWTGDNTRYWIRETVEATRQFDGKLKVFDGSLTPGQVARTFRRSKLALCLSEDSRPAYTVVEAALCGCIPIVSDCPGLREHFKEEGALFARKSPASIREAIEAGIAMPRTLRNKWARRNSNYFKTWTSQHHMPFVLNEIFKRMSCR